LPKKDRQTKTSKRQVCLKLVLSFLAMTSPSWATVDNQAAGTWLKLNIPDMVLISNNNFGAFSMEGDPTRPGTAYVCGDHQGLWKTTNFGSTWTRINTGAGGAVLNTGGNWATRVAPDGSYVLTNSGYGSPNGVFKSIDGGVSWINKTETVTSDVNDIAISPLNPLHVITTPHNNPADWFESLDGGESWQRIQPQPGAGIWYAGQFLDDSTYIGIGPNGVWRGVKSGGTWTFESLLPLNGPHGGFQMHRDAARGFFYVGGEYSGSFRPQVWRTTLSSRGAAGTWTLVADVQSGAGAVGTVWGTPTMLYGQGNFAITGGSYGPYAQMGAANPGTNWSLQNTPPEMINGAHHAAVMFDGTNYIILTGNGIAGVWRYVEPAAGSPASRCDLNADSRTDVSDMQLCINQAIRIVSCTTGDINSDGNCSVIDVQRVVNAILDGNCITQ
jgi:hypothetical protein